MKLSIKEPCDEKWDNMTPTKKGRFCGVCETEVVDFTKMDKQEITSYFINSKKKICCRIEDTKLEDPSSKDRKNRLKLKPVWVAAASMFVFSKIAVAQGGMYLHPEGVKNNSKNKIDSLNTQNKTITVYFQIINEKSKKGIAFAKINFLDLKLSTKTDKRGNCHVTIPTIKEGLHLEINGLKHQIIISNEKDLQFTFAIKEEELTLIKRIEIDKEIEFLKAKEKIKAITDSITVSGIVIDEKTKKPVENVEIIAEHDSLEIEFSTFTDSLGKFELILPKSDSDNYFIETGKKDYHSDDKEIKTSKSIKLKFEIKKGKKYRTIGCPSF